MKKGFTKLLGLAAVIMLSTWNIYAAEEEIIFHETFNNLTTANTTKNALTGGNTDESGYTVGGGGSNMKCTIDGTMDLNGGRFETRKMDLTGAVTLYVTYKISGATTKKFQIDIDKTGTSNLGGLLNEAGGDSPTEFTTKEFEITNGTASSFIHFRTESSHIIIIDEIKITRKELTPSISSFKIGELEANIDEEAGTITATLPYGTDLSAIEPIIILGGSAESYNPTGPQDFSDSETNPIIYNAYSAEQAESKSYNVTVTEEDFISDDATLKNLKVNETTIEGFSAETLSYEMNFPYGTALPVVAAEVNYIAATATITQIEAYPGTATVLVTAQNGDTKTYSISFTQTPAATEKEILSFSINDYVGVLTENAITLTMHNNTDITNLTPVITISEFATYTPTSAQDFTNPVTYTVTAQDGSTQDYVVTVSIADLSYTGTYPYETNIPSDFEIPVWMHGNVSFSNEYENANDYNWKEEDEEKASIIRMNAGNSKMDFFLSKCSYFEIQMSATGGRTFKLYVNGDEKASSGSITKGNKVKLSYEVNKDEPVIVSIENVGTGGATIGYIKIEGEFTPPSSEKDITAFSINGIAGVIAENTITVTLDSNVDVTALTPVVTVSEKAIYSPEGAQNFTQPVTYTVTAEDTTTKDYIVTVVLDPVGLGKYTIDGISFDGRTILNNNNQLLYLFNVSGSMVISSNRDIDMSNQPQGIYLVKSSAGVMKITLTK